MKRAKTVTMLTDPSISKRTMTMEMASMMMMMIRTPVPVKKATAPSTLRSGG